MISRSTNTHARSWSAETGRTSTAGGIAPFRIWMLLSLHRLRKDPGALCARIQAFGVEHMLQPDEKLCTAEPFC